MLKELLNQLTGQGNQNANAPKTAETKDASVAKEATPAETTGTDNRQTASGEGAPRRTTRRTTNNRNTNNEQRRTGTRRTTVAAGEGTKQVASRRRNTNEANTANSAEGTAKTQRSNNRTNNRGNSNRNTSRNAAAGNNERAGNGRHVSHGNGDVQNENQHHSSKKDKLMIIPLGGLGEICKNMTVRAVVITHGHEDHIGSLAYLLKEINVPVYATNLVCGLIEGKLKENKVGGVKLNVVKAGDEIRVGSFKVGFIQTNHSIPDACAVYFETPGGTVVHTGD